MGRVVLPSPEGWISTRGGKSLSHRAAPHGHRSWVPATSLPLSLQHSCTATWYPCTRPAPATASLCSLCRKCPSLHVHKTSPLTSPPFLLHANILGRSSLIMLLKGTFPHTHSPSLHPAMEVYLCYQHHLSLYSIFSFLSLAPTLGHLLLEELRLVCFIPPWTPNV